MRTGFRFFSILFLLVAACLYFSVPDVEDFFILKESMRQEEAQKGKETTGLFFQSFSLTTQWPFLHSSRSHLASSSSPPSVACTRYYLWSILIDEEKAQVWLGIAFHWVLLQPWFDWARHCLVPFERCSYHGVLVSGESFFEASDGDASFCLCFPSWTVELDCSLSVRKFDPWLFTFFGLLELLTLLSLLCTVCHRFQCGRVRQPPPSVATASLYPYARPLEGKGNSFSKWQLGTRWICSLYSSPSIVHLIQVLTGIYQLGPWMVYRLGPWLTLLSWTGVSGMLGLGAWMRQRLDRCWQSSRQGLGASFKTTPSVFFSTIGPSGSLLMMRTIYTMDLFTPSYAQPYSYWVNLSQWIAAQALIDAAIGPRRRVEWMSYAIAVGVGWALYRYYFSLPLKIF